jgi:hypothetical protein
MGMPAQIHGPPQQQLFLTRDPLPDRFCPGPRIGVPGLHCRLGRFPRSRRSLTLGRGGSARSFPLRLHRRHQQRFLLLLSSLKRQLRSPRGAVALAEGGHGRRPFVRCSDGEREFGESCGDPVVRVEVDG